MLMIIEHVALRPSLLQQQQNLQFFGFVAEKQNCRTFLNILQIDYIKLKLLKNIWWWIRKFKKNLNIFL